MINHIKPIYDIRDDSYFAIKRFIKFYFNINSSLFYMDKMRERGTYIIKSL